MVQVQTIHFINASPENRENKLQAILQNVFGGMKPIDTLVE